MRTIKEIEKLLSVSGATDAANLPARIESLEIAAFDAGLIISDLADAASAHEETALVDASTESNEAKRKAKRAELLRASAAYNCILREKREAERVRLCLQERAHRYAREFRLAVAEKGGQI